jgi:DNA repair exonuclease SbcCD ATPase subunit
LGDIARQEEARRKTIKTPAKVYTNDVLRSEPAPPPAAPTAQTPAQAAAPPSPSGSGKPADAQTPQPAPTDEKKTEAYWKQRLQAERDALSRAQIFAEALQSRINALTTDFAARSDPAQRDVIASDRQKALAELDRVKKEIQGHQKAITDIQEEARRAGVPAGWVR